MKLLIMIMVAALLAACGSGPQPKVYPAGPLLKEEVDRFGGYTSYDFISDESNYRVYRPELRLIASIDTAGGYVRELWVGFVASGVEWRYLRCPYVSWLADGQRVSAGEPDHDGTVGTGYVMEYLNMRPTRGQLETLAAATTIEVKVCNDEFRLTDGELRAIRELSELIKRSGKGPAGI